MTTPAYRTDYEPGDKVQWTKVSHTGAGGMNFSHREGTVIQCLPNGNFMVRTGNNRKIELQAKSLRPKGDRNEITDMLAPPEAGNQQRTYLAKEQPTTPETHDQSA